MQLLGVFWNRFLKETSQVDGRTKNSAIKRLLHGTLWLRNSPSGKPMQNGRPTDEIPRDPITPWCDPPLCVKFRNFLLRNKALVYLLYFKFNAELRHTGEALVWSKHVSKLMLKKTFIIALQAAGLLPKVWENDEHSYAQNASSDQFKCSLGQR